MKRRLLYGTTSLLLLGACNSATTTNTTGSPFFNPASSVVVTESFQPQNGTTLEAWWSFFGDEVLDRLISSALNLNPQGNNADLGYQIGLISDVAYNYLEYRYVQNQKALLDDYIGELDDVIERSDSDREREKRKAEQALLDEKAEGFVSKKASLIKAMTALTKLLPEFVEEVLRERQDIPQADVTPLFASSADVMMNAPEIIEARIQFSKSHLQGKPEDTAFIFPDVTVSHFFNIPDDAYLNDDGVWRSVDGASLDSLSLDGLRSQYKTSSIYTVFENAVYAYVGDVENLITQFTHIQVQKNILRKAADQSKNTYTSYSKHIDEQTRNMAQNDAYKAQLAWLRAEYETSKTLIDLYKKIGVH